MKKKIAVDFDGTLCEYNFPYIGKQNKEHKELMDTLIKLKESSDLIIIWTNRVDN